ncbi:MAG: SIS domain-containing protein [Acidobacteriota bacterium]
MTSDAPSVQAFVDRYLGDLRRTARALDPEPIARAVEWLREVRDAGGTIFAAGNGGSATVASNLVVDLVKCGSFGRSRRFRAIHLADSVSTLTAFANDEGYATVFAEPLRNFARPGDLLIAISGSGESPNILAAVEAAQDLGCRTLGLTSGRQGRLRQTADLPLLVDSTHMGQLEDCFFVLSHALTYPFIEAVVDGAAD